MPKIMNFRILCMKYIRIAFFHQGTKHSLHVTNSNFLLWNFSHLKTVIFVTSKKNIFWYHSPTYIRFMFPTVVEYKNCDVSLLFKYWEGWWYNRVSMLVKYLPTYIYIFSFWYLKLHNKYVHGFHIYDMNYVHIALWTASDAKKNHPPYKQSQIFFCEIQFHESFLSLYR